MSASKELKAIGLTRAKAAEFCGKNADTIRNWYMDNYALFEIVKAGLEVKLKDSVNRYRRFIIFDIESKKPAGLSGIQASCHTLEEAKEMVKECELDAFQIIDRDTWEIVHYEQ